MRSFAVFSALVIFALTIHSSASAETDTLRHHFSTDGDSYSFTGEFTASGGKNCLLDMLYDPRQLRQYARHADGVEVAGRGDGWQTVVYDYSGLFYRSRSTFKRTLDTAGDRINYRLIAIEQQGLISPDITSISGYYKVSSEEECCRVTFHQQGVIGSNGMLSDFYFYTAEKEAVTFLDNMRRHAAENCP